MNINGSSIHDYSESFVQRTPRYAVKRIGGKAWRTRWGELSDDTVGEHLDGEKAVASLGRWYPGHAIIDIDDRELAVVENIRDRLGMDDSTSFLCTSESPDSYHLVFRPTYNGRPPTIRLLNEILEPFAASVGVEIYPKPTKPARLPFGRLQRILDPGYEHLEDWNHKLYWFQKLDPVELRGMPASQTYLPLLDPVQKCGVGTYYEGQEYLTHGLQHPSSRNHAQFCVLYYLWRRNMPIEAAIDTVWRWIQESHHGYSKDILRHRQAVHDEIVRQASRIWSNYRAYPDDPNNVHFGYLTAEDLPEIARIAGGSLPRMRFLYSLIKFAYPRRYRGRIPIHSDLLLDWGSPRTYLRRLAELEQKGIVARESSYFVGSFAKHLVVNWPWRDAPAILVEDRAPLTFEDTAREGFDPRDFRALLTASGMKPSNASTYTRQVYRVDRDTEGG